MFNVVLVLTLIGASAAQAQGAYSNRSDCIAVATETLLLNLTRVINNDVNSTIGGARNLTENTVRLVQNATSMVLADIRTALSPLRNATSFIDLAAKSTKASIQLATVSPKWIMVYAGVGAQTGVGGVQFARAVVRFVLISVEQTISHMNDAILSCLRRN